MKVSLLASGSTGNCLAVEHNGCLLLVDAGLSARKTVSRLESAGLENTLPVAMLLSHEHSDHSRGIGVVARKLRIPVFSTSGTARAMADRHGRNVSWNMLENGEEVFIEPFLVKAFRLPHDATDPSGYVIECDGAKLGVATDLGSANVLAENFLKGCKALVLEFNHDEEMLWTGKYPWPLKQRISSSTGHLSNTEASKFLSHLIHPELSLLLLAHLSQENNTPELALAEARSVAGSEISVIVGRPYEAIPAKGI